MLKRFKISFKSALIILTVLLILLPVTVVLTLSWYYHFNTVKQIAIESESAKSGQLLMAVESEIKRSSVLLERKAAAAADIINNTYNSTANVEILESLLETTLNQENTIQSLFIIDASQNFMAGLDSTSNDIEKEALLLSYYTDSLRQHILELKTSVENKRYTQPNVIQSENKIIIISPIVYKGLLSGFLFANIDALGLWESANNLYYSSRSANHYSLINSDGQIFFDPDGAVEPAGKTHASDGVSRALPIIADANFKQGGEAFLIETGERFFLVSPFNSLNMALLTEFSPKFYISKLYEFITWLILILITLVAIIISFGLFVLPFFVKPLERLKAAFREVSAAEQAALAYTVPQLPHSPITEFDQLVVGFQSMHQARVLAEQSLLLSEQNLSLTLTSIGDAVIVTDPLGFITRMNPAAETLTGWTQNDALRQPLTKIFHIVNAHTRQMCENPVDKVISTGAVVGLANHTVLISKAGEEYQIADSAAPIVKNEDTIGVILVFRDVTEEYRLKEAVAESQKFLSGLVNDMETLVGALDLDGTLIFTNNTPLLAAGLTEADVIGKKFWQCPWFEGLVETQKKLIDAIDLAAKGQSSFLLLQGKLLHGVMWAEFNIHPVFDDQGKVKYLVPEGRDVSQRILAEEQLEKNKLQAQSIFDNASSLIFVKDLKGRYLLVNKGMEDFFGVNKDVFFGKTDIEMFGDVAQKSLWKENFEQALKERRTIEFEEEIHFNKNHYIFLSTKFFLYDVTGEAYAFCSISTDISERVQMEKKLRASELRLRQHREKTPIGIIECNSDFEIIDWNPGAEKIFGFSEAEALGNTVVELLIPNENREDFSLNCQSFIMEKESQQHFFTNKNKRGEILYCEWFCAPLFDVNGKLLAVTAEIIDKTTQKHQEEQLKRSQKMQALGTLTGGIAHDFNNMLGVVMGYAEMIEQSDKLDSSLKKYLQEILSAGERGSRLTKKLLAFSRQKHAQSEVLNINQLLLEDQDMLEKVLTARIKLKFELDEQLWPVCVDKSDLEDAVLNMSINAQHAIAGNGYLTISTSNIVLDSAKAELFQIDVGDYVKLDVRDNGSGMDEYTMGRIFEPFFTTKKDAGNGLGLSQVYGFMKRSLGAISVDSSPGQGAVFTLLFPRSLEAIEEVVEQESPGFAVINNKNAATVLVVDDELALRNLAKEILSQHGYNVICAKNGREAMDMLSRNKVALVVSDVIMPLMDGYQLAAAVQEKYPEIKILLTSGFTDRRVFDRDENQLYKQLLYKPYSSKELLGLVNELLTGASELSSD